MSREYKELSEKYNIQNDEYLLSVIKGYFDFETSEQAKELDRLLKLSDSEKAIDYSFRLRILITAVKNGYDVSDIVTRKYPRATRNSFLKGLGYTLRVKKLID